MWQSPQHRCGVRGWPRIYRTAARIACLLALPFVLATALRADINVKGGIIVTAKPAAVSAVVGQTVKIPLEGAQSSGTKRINFRIIKEPGFGKLSEVETDPNDSSRGWVFYQAPAGTKPAVDTFSYNAKVDGVNASRSVEVKVTLVNPVARLSSEPELLFGQVEIGQSTTQSIVISNTGTKVFTKTFELSAPWSVAPAQKTMVIAPGEQLILDLTFSPTKVGPERFELKLIPGSGLGKWDGRALGSWDFAI